MKCKGNGIKLQITQYVIKCYIFYSESPRPCEDLKWIKDRHCVKAGKDLVTDDLELYNIHLESSFI